MKTIVIYSSKSGAARECAELLAEKMKDCAVCDLAKETPDIDAAETIIIGSGVRMGTIYRPVRKFIKENLENILSKRTAIYLCNAEPGTYEKTVEKNIPAQLVTNALCI